MPFQDRVMVLTGCDLIGRHGEIVNVSVSYKHSALGMNVGIPVGNVAEWGHQSEDVGSSNAIAFETNAF